MLICNAGISMRALFDEVDLGVLKRLMDVNFWGTVYCTKYALPVYSGLARIDRRRVVGSRISRPARPHGLFGLEIRDDRISGDGPHREPEKGSARNDRGSGFHGVERTFLSPDRRWIGSGRVAAQGGEDDERRRSGRRIARGVVRRKRTLAMDFNGRATVLIKKFAPGLLDRLYYSHMAKEPDSPLK